jgi:hypothetical protein
MYPLNLSGNEWDRVRENPMHDLSFEYVPTREPGQELSELGCDWHHYMRRRGNHPGLWCFSIKSRGFMAYWPAPDQQTLLAVASGDVI